MLHERRRRKVFIDPRTTVRFEETRHRCGACSQHVWFSAEHNVTLCRTEECPLHKPAETEAKAKFVNRIQLDS